MDGLRGFACLTVFLANFHHSMGMTVAGQAGPFDLATFAESGIGVALFLVMSGALLSLPFWRSFVAGALHVPWRLFLVRRFLRLAPAYYLCLAALVVAGGLSDDVSDVALHVLFLNNLRESSFYGVSPQFWTIGLFAQLAFILPIGFAVVARLTNDAGRAAWLVGALAAASYLMHAGIMASGAVSGLVWSHSTLAHVPIFLMGVAGGHALAGPARGGDLLFWPAFTLLLAVSSAPAAEALTLPHGRYLLPLMPALAVAVTLTAPSARAARLVFDTPPLRWLGVVSYGIYIFHVPAMEAVRRFVMTGAMDTTTEKAQFAAVSLALTIVVATASYLVVERPLLRRARGWSRL